MKRCIAIIILVLLSRNFCRSQGIHLKYLFRKSVYSFDNLNKKKLSDTSFFYQEAKFSMNLRYTRNHQLSIFEYDFNGTVESLFYLYYDELNRLSKIDIYEPEEELYFNYSDSSNYFTSVVSSNIGTIQFAYKPNK